MIKYEKCFSKLSDFWLIILLHLDARSNVNVLVLKTRSLLGVTSTLEMEPTPSPRWDTGISFLEYILKINIMLDSDIWSISKESWRDRHEGDLLGARSLSRVRRSIGTGLGPPSPLPLGRPRCPFLMKIIRTS